MVMPPSYVNTRGRVTNLTEKATTMLRILCNSVFILSYTPSRKQISRARQIKASIL